ncbi:MAG: hypothetical protein H0X17_15075 [Deltaproteobacteria bacterium]|nr:hypothetical protein [Deltaproteobacteria bacterium]
MAFLVVMLVLTWSGLGAWLYLDRTCARRHLPEARARRSRLLPRARTRRSSKRP